MIDLFKSKSGKDTDNCSFTGDKAVRKMHVYCM